MAYAGHVAGFRRLAVRAALAIGVYVALIRPRLLSWSATDDELRTPHPGADLLTGAQRGATMAVTIDAPPSRLWPWLVQMGCDRAGWYSWDRLDNGGTPSARAIRPEWQRIAIGDRLASVPSGRAWFEVVALEPERFLALRAPLDLRGRPFDTADPPPRLYSDSLWCFLLQELPGERTRLVVSGYLRSRPKLLARVGNLLFWEPAHVVIQRRQFSNLRRRAEREYAPDTDTPDAHPSVAAAP